MRFVHIGKISRLWCLISMHMTGYILRITWISHWNYCSISQSRCRDKRGDKKFAASALQLVWINSTSVSHWKFLFSVETYLLFYLCYIPSSQIFPSLRNSVRYYYVIRFAMWTKVSSCNYRLLFKENSAAENLHEFLFFRQYNPDVGKIKIQIHAF